MLLLQVFNEKSLSEERDDNISILFITQPSNNIIQCKSFEVRNMTTIVSLLEFTV